MGLITGKTILDYFILNCSKCNEQVDINIFQCKNNIPYIEYKCEKCGSYGVLKLNQSRTKVITH